MYRMHEPLISARYHAPRGKKRLFMVAAEISRRYLYADDLLIGVIGLEGSGKSTLIKGLFPGLELTNEDDGINKRPAPIYDFSEENFFSGHTFHVDVRYELAFKQKYEIAAAINRAVNAGRRVVVEHFDLIYKQLGYNAQVLFTLGDALVIFRPTVLGPSPVELQKFVAARTKYRLMAHTAEDITSHILERDYRYKTENLHSDVRHGFVVPFTCEPDIDIRELENKVLDIIRRGLDVRPLEGNYIAVGEDKIYCTGKRIHVKNTADIENFRLVKRYIYDPISKEYWLVGITGEEDIKPNGFTREPPAPETAG